MSSSTDATSFKDENNVSSSMRTVQNPKNAALIAKVIAHASEIIISEESWIIITSELEKKNKIATTTSWGMIKTNLKKSEGVRPQTEKKTTTTTKIDNSSRQDISKEIGQEAKTKKRKAKTEKGPQILKASKAFKREHTAGKKNVVEVDVNDD